MDVCIYACMMYVCTQSYSTCSVCEDLHVCIYVCVCMMYVCTQGCSTFSVCKDLHVRMYVCVCIHTYIHIHTHTHTHTYKHTLLHLHIITTRQGASLVKLNQKVRRTRNLNIVHDPLTIITRVRRLNHRSLSVLSLSLPPQTH
jgi:hypothetical protein